MTDYLKEIETLGRVARSNAALSVTPDAWKEHAARLTDLYEKVAVLLNDHGLIVRAKDGAYGERNRLVAALANVFPAGIKRTEIEGWDQEWHNCIYIDLPTGQVSWHYHDNESVLFDHLDPYPGEWDGHTTEEKYERLANLAGLDTPSPDAQRIEVVLPEIPPTAARPVCVPDDAQALELAVNRFLCWKLPPDFVPDAGISFTPTHFQQGENADLHWPVGTNLLTADQARDMLAHVLVPVPLTPPPPRPASRDERQAIVGDWVERCFGTAILADMEERLLRVMEETAELAQSEGITQADWEAIGRYVFDRPAGQPHQELGGVCVTLLAYAHAKGESLQQAEGDEIARILAKPVEDFQRRNAEKEAAGVGHYTLPEPTDGA